MTDIETRNLSKRQMQKQGGEVFFFWVINKVARATSIVNHRLQQIVYNCKEILQRNIRRQHLEYTQVGRLYLPSTSSLIFFFDILFGLYPVFPRQTFTCMVLFVVWFQFSWSCIATAPISITLYFKSYPLLFPFQSKQCASKFD